MTRVGSRMRTALGRVAIYETPGFGVIVHHSTGTWAIKRGFAVAAQRRHYARQTGLCIRLTPLGRELIEGTG